jgi:DNA-directed RNA polymerase specialized sigma24 family protein
MPYASARKTDPDLRQFLAASTDAEATQHLENLMRQMAPVIDGIIRRKLRVSPGVAGGRADGESLAAEDVRGEILLQLIRRLWELRESPQSEEIGNFRGFVAVTAYRVCDSHLRKRFPQRASLRNKLAYLLTKRTNQQGLALWEDADGERLCGFEVWRDRRRLERTPRYLRLLERPEAAAAEALPREDPAHVNPGDLLAALFNLVGSPINLDDLVNVVAQLWGVRDIPERQAAAQRDEESPDPYLNVADSRVAVATEAEQRAYLQHLWSEVRQLPPRQCAALLLNLRDGQGRGVIALLPLLRIASLREVAAALDLSPERFAQLWNDLPLEDAVIAELLACTRQQVINLRKVARERLARRMRALEASG